jgi:hypothetical protein
VESHEYRDSERNRTAAGANRELNLDVVLDIPVTLSMEVVISPAERIRQLK